MEIEDDKLLRQKGVAELLNISRHTLARIQKYDATFPRSFEISPGIRLIRAREVRAWLRSKELAAREKTASALKAAPNTK